MLKLYRPESPDDGSKADLDDMDAALAHLLQPLLLGRFHADVWRLWAYLRCCVASAQEGDRAASIEAMDRAVAALSAIVERRFGPGTVAKSTCPRLGR
jgi:hypothetical protein